MDIKDYLFGTTSLMGVIEPLHQKQPPRFLLNLLCPNEDTQETKEIHLDKVVEDKRIAAFVAPLIPGKARSRKGFSTDVFSPAYIKEKDRLTPDEMISRLAGEPLGGSMSADDRAMARIGDLIGQQRTRIRRRLEVMAAELAVDGQLTITGEDYPTKIVSYGRHASMRVSLTLAARWGETDVSPVDNVDEWANAYGERNGSAANELIMTRDAWQLFKQDPKLEKMLDRQLGQQPVVDLGFTRGVPGRPIFKGSIDGLNIWVYNDTYEDQDGNTQSLLPPYTVLLASTEVFNGWQAFGLIHDFGSLSAMDMFSKTWAQEDPSALNILTQSAPLLVPSRPDGVMSVTVR